MKIDQMNTATTEGSAIATGLQIKSVKTVLHSVALQNHNAEALTHGPAWDKLDVEAQNLVNNAENLTFDELQEQVNGLNESRLMLLQERMRLFAQRQSLLKSIHGELEDRVTQCKADIATAKEKTAAGLRAAGMGPEDSDLWKRGHTNMAEKAFEKTIAETHAVIQAEKAWRNAKELRDRVFPANEWSSEAELREDLRAFVASRVA